MFLELLVPQPVAFHQDSQICGRGVCPFMQSSYELQLILERLPTALQQCKLLLTFLAWSDFQVAVAICQLVRVTLMAFPILRHMNKLIAGVVQDAIVKEVRSEEDWVVSRNACNGDF